MRRMWAVALVAILLLVPVAPASAQEAQGARAEAYGVEVSGLVDLGPLPETIVAEVPPGESDSDSFLEVPVEPLVFSGTIGGDVEASRHADLDATLQAVMDGASSVTLPQTWNARGHAITEDLGLLFLDADGDLPELGDLPDLIGEDLLGEVEDLLDLDLGGLGELEELTEEVDADAVDEGTAEPAAADGGGDAVADLTAEELTAGQSGEASQDGETDGAAELAQAEPAQDGEALLTAEVVESEAVATCDGDEPVFATGSRVQQLQLAGEPIPLLDDLLGTAVELVISGEPNEDVLANLPVLGEVLAELGLEIVAWDTNWDGADGTLDGSDTVWANALRVSVVEGSTLGDLVGAQDVTVSHSSANVDCAEPVDPLRDLAKDASVDTVAPGETFTYTITVPNAADSNCTLTDVRVVDTITGPAGSQIVGTDPEADTIDDLTVTWDDIGPIEPGDSVTLSIDVQVPDDAPAGETYREDVAVTALCDGVDVDGDLDFEGPEVQPVTKPGDADQVADRTLPETGGGMLALGLALLGAAGLAALLRQRV